LTTGWKMLIDSRQGQQFSCSLPSASWFWEQSSLLSGVLSPGVKRAERQTDVSPHYNSRVKIRAASCRSPCMVLRQVGNFCFNWILLWSIGIFV